MKKVSLILTLFLLGQYLQAQEPSTSLTAKVNIKEGVHTAVEVQNTFRINSKKLEFSPTYYQNGIVYVTADMVGKKIDGNIGVPFFELFYAELDGAGMPSNPQSFSAKVNSPTHEGPVAFNFREDLLYFTSNSELKNSKGKFTNKIFEATRGGDDWENKKALPFNSNEYYTMHPTLVANGMKLYFASDRPGGYGGTDIYYVEKLGEEWQEPVNMGPTVNTNKNEAFPYIHESGMLFFSSEGHAGLGGYDIYAVNTLEKEVSELLHLGTPFNSAQADFGLILNPTGTQGYFTSARIGGIGQDDIYLFDAPNGLFAEATPTTAMAKITVLEELNGTLIPNAGVYVFEKNKSGLYGKEDLYEVVLEAKSGNPDEMEVRFVMKEELGQPHFYTDVNGLINTQLATNQDYLFLVTKEGYANKELRYSTTGQMAPMLVQIPLSSKQCITLSGIVRNVETGVVIPNAKILIESDCDNSSETMMTNANGLYEYCLPRGCDYGIRVEKEGFSSIITNISTKNLTQPAIYKDINLKTFETSLNISSDKLEEGATIVLENIYYDFNKSAIRAGAAEELDALVTLMQQYPSMEVELTAHTDARGDTKYNRTLSRQRAFAAKDYLAMKGISEARITARGMGEVAIRNHCENDVKCSDEEHQYNRRTEVKVTKLLENIDVRYSGK